MGFIKDVVKGVAKSLALAGLVAVGKKMVGKSGDPIGKLKDKIERHQAKSAEVAEPAVEPAEPVRKPRARKPAGADGSKAKTVSTIKKTAASTTPKPTSAAQAKPRTRKPKVEAAVPAADLPAEAPSDKPESTA